MKKVQAVTQDIMFAAKIASFRPIEAETLAAQFADWIEQRGQEQSFVVWVDSIEMLQGEMRDSK
jgi:hypothetical protein